MTKLTNSFLCKCKNNNLVKFTVFLLILIAFFQIKSIADSSFLSSKNELKNFNNNLKNYKTKLTIFDNQNNMVANFLVAKADTAKKQQYGLMNLKKLPENYGMIFIFNENKIANFWMKNTYISLDMIFIDENNIITKIASNTIPKSLKTISSDQKINKVLEINAGLSKKLNIKTGHKVKF